MRGEGDDTSAERGVACRAGGDHLDRDFDGVVARGVSIGAFVARNTARGGLHNFTFSAGVVLARVFTDPRGVSFGTLTRWSNVAF